MYITNVMCFYREIFLASLRGSVQLQIISHEKFSHLLSVTCCYLLVHVCVNQSCSLVQKLCLLLCFFSSFHEYCSVPGSRLDILSTICLCGSSNTFGGICSRVTVLRHIVGDNFSLRTLCSHSYVACDCNWPLICYVFIHDCAPNYN